MPSRRASTADADFRGLRSVIYQARREAISARAGLLDKADRASPIFTGTPAAPTPPAGTNTDQLATTAYVAAAIAALINAAPGALDTLKELADALGDDANFSATLTASLAGKQPLDADLTAIAALATTAYGRALLVLADAAALTALLNPFTALLSGSVPASGGGTANFLRADGAWAPPSAPVAFSTVEVNLGANPRRGGRFTIAGVGLTVGKPVYIQQAVGPYTGKGTRADEAEMDQLLVTASVTSATQITAYWRSRGIVRGNVKFNYLIGA